MGRRLSQDEAKRRSDLVGVKMIGKYVNTRTKILFKCPFCNKYFFTLPELVWRKDTQSCGCYHDIAASQNRMLDLTNKRFGKLIALKNTNTKSTGGFYIWKCICDCGRYKNVHTGHLRSRNTKSCGNCGNNVNGVATSFAALSLHDMVDKDRNFTFHNYMIKSCNTRVDIAIPSMRIIVEYDEWFWHGHHLSEDNIRYKSLLNYGWKVLQIKARNNLPTQQQLDNALFNLLFDTNSFYIIELDGWGIGSTKFDNGGN